MKSIIYEGGVYLPLFIHLPKKLKAGHRNDRGVAHIDILPTLLEACGSPIPSNVKLDGRSFWPLLKGKETEWLDRYIVIQAHRGNVPVLYHNFTICNQKWKLLHNSYFHTENFEGEPKFELFNMENDPLEMEDLTSQRPDIVEKMRKAY